jgi:hypothetical protein
MSVASNVLTKMKQLWYNTGANSEVVATAVDNYHGCILSCRLPNGADGALVNAAANGSVVMTVPFDARLMTASYTPTTATTEVAGDDVIITVSTNGVAAASYNSNAAAQGEAAVNAGMALSMTTVNSYIDAGEVLLVAYTMADVSDNYLDGILTMNFYKV